MGLHTFIGQYRNFRNKNKYYSVNLCKQIAIYLLYYNILRYYRKLYIRIETIIK